MAKKAKKKIRKKVKGTVLKVSVPLTLDKSLKIIKNENDWSILYDLGIAILRSMPKDTAFKYAINYFANSPYKIYSQGMKKFVATMQQYIKTKDKSIVDCYKKNNACIPDTVELTDFYMLISSFIVAIEMELEPIPIFEVLYKIEASQSKSVEDAFERTRQLLIDLIANKWPESKGIKVLYGANK